MPRGRKRVPPALLSASGLAPRSRIHQTRGGSAGGEDLVRAHWTGNRRIAAPSPRQAASTAPFYRTTRRSSRVFNVVRHLAEPNPRKRGQALKESLPLTD